MSWTGRTADADWESLRTFLAVVREGSLSGAARALQIAQPTVRRRIEGLERDYGVALFTRSPDGLLPTELALALAQPANAMADASAAFARVASASANDAGGTVRITASEVIGAEVLPPILLALRNSHPGLVFELSLNNETEDILGREADIAIRMVPPSQLSLVTRRVGAIRLGLFAHRRFVEVHGLPSSPDVLRPFALIGFERETAGTRALRSHSLLLRSADFSFRTDSDLGQLAAIRAGLGIGVCQVRLAARDRDLLPVLPQAFALELETWVVMHEDLRHVRRLRLTFDALLEGLTAHISCPGRS